jgi:hypothetical protein
MRISRGYWIQFDSDVDFESVEKVVREILQAREQIVEDWFCADEYVFRCLVRVFDGAFPDAFEFIL